MEGVGGGGGGGRRTVYPEEQLFEALFTQLGRDSKLGIIKYN